MRSVSAVDSFDLIDDDLAAVFESAAPQRPAAPGSTDPRTSRHPSDHAQTRAPPRPEAWWPTAGFTGQWNPVRCPG